MTSILMVPIHLDALVLEHDQAVVEARADFSRLPYAGRNQDVNVDVVNISENIVSKPFDDQNLYLKAGIHLHWALPDALTRGKHTPAGTDAQGKYTPARTDFPAVPNRWLVIRSRRATGGQESIEKTWVVESDYLYPDGTGDLAGSISFPFTPDPAKGNYRPFRYQGRRMPLDTWKAQDPQAQYLDKLTAVGYGEPTFAAFYPNCHSVFGFYDGEIFGIPQGLQYDVIGWYSDGTQDQLATFIRDFTAAQGSGGQGAPTAEQLKAALEKTLQWTVTLSPSQEFPEQMLCSARITFNPPASSTANPPESEPAITLAVGNTGTEALSAYLASKVDSAQKAVIEDQLEALQLAFRMEHRQLDIGARFVEARHEKGFSAVHGGFLWTITPETDPSSQANAMDAQEQSGITLPGGMAQKLDTLNLLQLLDLIHTTGDSSPATNPFDGVTGFLLRSDVVSGWPGLQANGYDSSDSSGKELPLLRMDRLSPNVLLCLFDGEVKSVAIHQKPETLHFGLDKNTQVPPAFYKMLRDSQGVEQQNLTIPSIPWQQETQRIIDISSLARNIQQKTTTTPFTAAQFALQMTEGVEEVVFQKE